MSLMMQIGLSAVMVTAGALLGWLVTDRAQRHCRHRSCGLRLRCPIHEDAEIHAAQTQGARMRRRFARRAI